MARVMNLYRLRWVLVIAVLLTCIYYVYIQNDHVQPERQNKHTTNPFERDLSPPTVRVSTVTTVPPHLRPPPSLVYPSQGGYTSGFTQAMQPIFSTSSLLAWLQKIPSTSRLPLSSLSRKTSASVADGVTFGGSRRPSSPSIAPSISCRSESTPSLAPNYYASPNDPLLSGRPFQVSDECWKYYGLPPKSFSKLDARGQFLSKFVFVTACSSNHYIESLDAIASIQAHWPGRKILYFDLGLTPAQVDQLTGQGNNRTKFCDVEYRVFNFSDYPPHVGRAGVDLLTYSWKILIINEVLQEYPGVFWVDSSVRFKKNDLKGYTSRLIDSKGFVFFSGSSTSIFATTAPLMYEYLPTDQDSAKKVTMWEANSMLIFNTADVYENVLKWAYACALVEDCIAPSRNITCKYGPTRSRTIEFLHCHRFDQSLLNILLANWWHFYDGSYVVPGYSGILQVLRRVTNFFDRNYCPVSD